MATAATRRVYWTFDDFCALIPEGQKADLIDGVIYVASPDNLEHSRIDRFLDHLLSDYLDETGIGGEVLGSRVAFRLDDEGAPEPDLAYVRPERLHLLQENYVDGRPDWAVEIVSPDSIERDYNKKRLQYERFGVPEYWIIDPLEQEMTCYRLGKDDTYKEVRPRKGVVTSKVIPGFWVRPEWFWRSPLPKKQQILAEILRKPGNS